MPKFLFMLPMLLAGCAAQAGLAPAAPAVAVEPALQLPPQPSPAPHSPSLGTSAGPSATPAELRSVAEANRGFGLALYKRLASKPGNIFISPISLAGAFGPVAAGARGPTRAAIGKVLGFPADEPLLHRSLGGLLRGLETDREGARVSIANALWLMRGFPVKPAFVELAKQNYDAQVDTLDFRNSAEAEARINQWVDRETNSRIPQLFGPNSFNELTALVVTNAVYFLGDWTEPFNAALTRSETFYLADGGTRAVPMMSGDRYVRYLDADPVRIVELPYKGERLAMVAILPKERGGLTKVEAGLSHNQLSRWLQQLDAAEQQGVVIQLPKVKVEGSYELVEPLKAAGMATAFDRFRADFSGIADRQLFITDVIHKTFLRIDEKGTEAAAATGITIGAERSGPDLLFKADHPFLILIRDRQTGAVLFLGRIADPRFD